MGFLIRVISWAFIFSTCQTFWEGAICFVASLALMTTVMVEREEDVSSKEQTPSD